MAAGRRGFTLVEMLVVIGIILVILGLAAPMITRAWRAGDRASTYNDLQAISAALEAYRTDHGDYPRVFPPPKPIDDKFNGARMLCRALIGPGPGVVGSSTTTTESPKIPDGAGASDKPGNPETLPAPGFRVRGTQGKVYGPYLPPERFKLGDPSTPPKANPDPGYLAILDKYNRPILYYPGLGKPNINAKDGFVKAYNPLAPLSGVRPLYNANDNIGGIPATVFPKLMGDTNGNGMIDSTGATTETAAYDGPFVLWSSGPDEVFGPNPTKSDDITNFRQ